MMHNGDQPSIPLMPHARESGANVKRCLVIAIATLTISPLLYVLSIGPAYHARVRNGISDEDYNALYAPILNLCEQYDEVDEFVHWYAELWI